jgi:hypothetical protein
MDGLIEGNTQNIMEEIKKEKNKRNKGRKERWMEGRKTRRNNHTRSKYRK